MVEFRSFGRTGWASSWPLDPQAPTLLLVHCAGFNSSLWLPVVRSGVLSGQWLAVDLPGHGQSELAARETVAEMAEDLRNFVEMLGLREVLVAGNSLGGAVTLQLLTEAPEWLKGAGLVATGARLKVMPQILAMVKVNYAAYIAHFMEVALGPDADKAALRSQSQEAVESRSEVALKDFLACNGFDLMEQLARVQVPVVVIHGGRDQVTPLKYGEFLQQQLAQSRWVLLERAGHLLPLERPLEVAEALQGLARELWPQQLSD